MRGAGEERRGEERGGEERRRGEVESRDFSWEVLIFDDFTYHFQLGGIENDDFNISCYCMC